MELGGKFRPIHVHDNRLIVWKIAFSLSMLSPKSEHPFLWFSSLIVVACKNGVKISKQGAGSLNNTVKLWDLSSKILAHENVRTRPTFRVTLAASE